MAEVSEEQLDAIQEWLDHHPLNFEHLCIRCEMNGWEPCEKHKPDPPGPPGLMQMLPSSASLPRPMTAAEILRAYGSPVAVYERWAGGSSRMTTEAELPYPDSQTCAVCQHPAAHHDAGECWTGPDGAEVWSDRTCRCDGFEVAGPLQAKEQQK